MRMRGSNPVVLAEAHNMAFVLDPYGAAPSAASFAVRHGATPVIAFEEAGDNVGVLVKSGAPGVSNAYLALSTAGTEHLRLGGTCGAGVTVETDLVARKQVCVYGDTAVHGGLYAARYDNLVDDFISTTPFLPPTANALARAFTTLSNLVVLTAGGCGGGTHSSSSNNSNYDGWCGESWTGATLSDTNVDATLMGPVACADLVVLPGGSVTARSFCNLVDSFHESNLGLPPTANALNAAYVQLSNFVITRMADFITSMAASDGHACGSTAGWHSNVPTSVSAAGFQAAMWLPSTDDVNRIRFNARGPTILSAPPDSHGNCFRFMSSTSQDDALTISSNGALIAAGGAAFGDALIVQGSIASLGSNAGVTVPWGNISAGGDAAFGGSLDVGGSQTVAGALSVGGAFVAASYSNLPPATAITPGVVRVITSLGSEDSNVAASAASLRTAFNGVDDKLHILQNLMGDVLYSTSLASNMSAAASNVANAPCFVRRYSQGIASGVDITCESTDLDSGVRVVMRNMGGGEAELLLNTSNNAAVLANRSSGMDGEVILESGRVGVPPCCQMAVGQTVEVRRGVLGDIEFPPDLTANYFHDVSGNDGGISFSAAASSTFSTDAWAQAYQGVSRSPSDTCWISASDAYDDTTGGSVYPGPVTYVTVEGAAAGTLSGMAGEWLQFGVSTPVYASRFFVMTSNRNSLPDDFALLGSADGGMSWRCLSVPGDTIAQAESVFSTGRWYAVTGTQRETPFTTFRLVILRVSLDVAFAKFATVAQVDVFKIRGSIGGRVPDTLFSVDQDALVVNRSGYVGIGGVLQPSAALHLGSRVAARTIVFHDPDPNLPHDVKFRGISVGSNHVTYRVEGPGADHVFASGDVEALRLVGSNGHVGVHNAAPQFTLDVDGDVNATGAFLHRGAPLITPEGDVSLGAMFVAGSGDGFVGIGTSNPSYSLEVTGDSLLGSALLGTACNVFRASNVTFTGDVRMQQSAYVGGWVGVGTDTPAYPLHVASGADGISIFCAGDMATFSDRREKNNLVRIPNALDKLLAIGGYTYTMGGGRHAGVVAQEVLQQLPEAVHEDPDTGRLAVSHGNLLALVIEAVRELYSKLGV